MSMHGSQFQGCNVCLCNWLCVTQGLCEKVMYETHAPPYAGHRGVLTTLKGAKMCFYWPTMKIDIHKYVALCMIAKRLSMMEGSN